jgi:hypothetical protein
MQGVTFQKSCILVEFYAVVTLKVARDCCVVEADVLLPCLLGRLD